MLVRQGYSSNALPTNLFHLSSGGKQQGANKDG